MVAKIQEQGDGLRLRMEQTENGKGTESPEEKQIGLGASTFFHRGIGTQVTSVENCV
jgi:hypothetical protein